MVRTRAMTIRPADSSSDTDMETSPRMATLPAPQQIEVIESVVAIRPTQHAVPTLLPISQPSQTLQDMLTSLPTAVKIEELDFNF